MKSLATLSGNNHNITLEKNNILLNNEHFRTVLGCCGAERPALASRTGAGHELTQLAPQVLFVLSASQHKFATVWFFFFFFFNILQKNATLSNTSQLQKQVHLGTVCIVLTVPQGWSLPPQMHTYTARSQLLSIEFYFFFLISFIFPIIPSAFSSQATFSPCCKCKSEQHNSAVHCRVTGNKPPKLASLKLSSIYFTPELMVIKFWHFYWLFQMRTHQQYKKAESAIQLPNIARRVRLFSRHKPCHQGFPSLMGMRGWFVFLRVFSLQNFELVPVFLVKWCLKLLLLFF